MSRSLPELVALWNEQRSRACGLIMRADPVPDAMDPGFHGVRTRWIRGFMTFRWQRRTRIVMLMVPE